MCGLRTRPRTDVDPPRVELPSAAGGYRLGAAGAMTCLTAGTYEGDNLGRVVAGCQSAMTLRVDVVGVRRVLTQSLA